MSAVVSAVLFVKDSARIAAFYRDVFDARVLSSDLSHAQLEVAGFRLLIQQIPDDLAKDIVVSTPPLRRENGSVRLDYPTRNPERSRTVARLLGGTIDEAPPAWAAGDDKFHLGHDPEGNVFCAVSAKP